VTPAVTAPAKGQPQLRDVPTTVIGQAGAIVIGGIVLGFLLARLLWRAHPLKLLA
jgi:hypothetical protein